jgi:hypothetical protein
MRIKKPTLAGLAATTAVATPLVAVATAPPANAVVYASVSQDFRCPGEAGVQSGALKFEVDPDSAWLHMLCAGSVQVRVKTKSWNQGHLIIDERSGTDRATVNPLQGITSACFFALDREGFWFVGQVKDSNPNNSQVDPGCNL